MSFVVEKQRPQPHLLFKFITAVTFVLLFLPLMCMIVESVWVPVEGVSGPQEWSFKFYLKIMNDMIIYEALLYSLLISILSTLGSTVIGTMAALAIERVDFPGKKFFNSLTMLPLVMPELVMGLSLLLWFVFLKLTLGTLSIVLAHMTFCLSYVMIIVRTRLKNFDESLEEAARDLGANSIQVLLKVTLPLLAPGILAAALMAFTLSFDDFLITFYTAGVGQTTLPVKIYSMIKIGIGPEIHALATLLFLVTSFVIILVFRPNQLKR